MELENFPEVHHKVAWAVIAGIKVELVPDVFCL